LGLAADASFQRLCAFALGAAKRYLTLAEAVRVLMLDDIPSLGSSNFNEANVSLPIDALY